MHELSYVEQVYSIVSKYAKEHKAKLVTSVYISASVLSGIENDSFLFYWDTLTKKTKLHDSKVYIRQTPVHIQCSSCHTSFVLRRYIDPLIQCTKCHSMKVVVSEESSIKIENIQIET